MTDSAEPTATVVVRAAVLDQMVKSIMQSVTANATKRRRVNPKTQTYRDAERESALLNEALASLLASQSESFGGAAR